MNKVGQIVDLIKSEELTTQDVCKIMDSLPKKTTIDVIAAIVTQHPDLIFGDKPLLINIFKGF